MKCNKHSTAYMMMCEECRHVHCKKCAKDKGLINHPQQCSACGGYKMGYPSYVILKLKREGKTG